MFSLFWSTLEDKFATRVPNVAFTADLFPILEPQTPEIGEKDVIRNRWSTDSEAPNV